MVELARKSRLPYIATNIPRRYAALVNSKGFEGLEMLSEQAKAFLPPLPVAYDPDLPAYKTMLEMVDMSGLSNENFPKAQAIKDASMAYFIVKNLKEEGLFLHFNGTYHSDNYGSIYWYISRKNPDLRVITITTVSQQSPEQLEKEYFGRADYIICVDEDMTSTH